MTEVLYILAGFLFGLSFLGGFYLFSIPVGLVALLLGFLNRPKAGAVPSVQKMTERMDRIVRAPQTQSSPKFLSDNEPQEYNEPSSSLKRKQIWDEVDNEVSSTLYEALQVLKSLLPDAFTVAIFFPSRVPGHYELKAFASESSSVIPNCNLAETNGLVGRLIKADVARILEGDLPGGKNLFYYQDDPPVRSIAGVPIVYRQKRRGCVVIDSHKANAFDSKTISVLKSFAQVVGNLSFKNYMSANNFIQKEQFSVLYHYQRHFFSTMSVKDIYKHIFEYIKGSIAYDRLMILALDRPAESMGHVVCADGRDQDFFINQEFSLNDKGILLIPLTRNYPLERNFVVTGPDDYVFRIKETEKPNFELRSMLAVPVATSVDEAAMVICLESCLPSRYTEHERELLTHIASAAGFAYLRTRAYEEKQELASRDGLTGLINHRTFQEKLRVEKLRSDRQGCSIGLLMTDIDKFKNINDTYGHPAGDAVIRTISSILSKEVRQDIDVVARYGGEEFVVMLIDSTEQGMRDTAERIRKAIERRAFDIQRAEPISATISIGAYLIKPEFKEVKKALEFADQALYKAKTSGRNRVVEYN
jgi:diguanylate cyclase (GGDEF)-like protein